LKGAKQIVETNSPHRPGVQLSYPTGKLVAIIDTLPDAEYARIELIAAGFAADAIGVQHGTRATERTVHYTDLDPFPHLARLLHVHSFEHEQAVAYEQALRRGQSVIAVHTPTATNRERALGIIEAHKAHYINFYGEWTIETLKR
jgi:predicted GTPase